MNALLPYPTEGWEEKARALVAELRSLRADPDAPFEYFDGGHTPGDDDPALSADIGATGWIESLDGTAEGWPSVEAARDRIRQGPPRFTR